jgi:RNA-directed DNA polymerase
MKRANHLIEKIADLNNLYLAFWKAGKGKRYSAETEAYRRNLDSNLVQLRTEILTGNVKVGNYHYFKLYDPKERDICAAAFSEQVLHHALMNVCHERFEKAQIYDSYASRVGKGTHAAIARAQEYTRKYKYYLKLDVRKFFASLSHEVLRYQIRRLFKEAILIEILDKIIQSYESVAARGVPIGNLTSQYLANHYLANLDVYIKKTLQIKGYVRYMDDLVLWDDEPAILKQAAQAIDNYANRELQCTLKPVVHHTTKQGLSFLGYLLYPYQIKLLRKSKLRYFRKVNFLNKQYYLKRWTEWLCQRHIRPILCFVERAEIKILKQQFRARWSVD